MDALLAELANRDNETYPKATVEDVATTEEAIGRPLPPSYRKLVTEFSNGAYLLMLQEVSAVGSGNGQIAPIQDIADFVGEGEVAVDGGGSVPSAQLVPFSLDSNGNAWCFLTGSPGTHGEYPVAYLEMGCLKLYGELPDFSEWLSLVIEEEDEVIRTLIEQGKVKDDLGLG